MVTLKNYVTTTEAAKILGCTPGRVRQLKDAGTFGKQENLLQVGKACLIPRKSVLRYSELTHKVGRPRKFSR